MFVAFIASHHIRMCCADVFTCSVLTRRCSISHAIIDGSGPKGRAGGSRNMHVNVANVCWKKKRWHFLRVRNEDVSRSRGIGCILSSVEHIPYTSTQAHNFQLHKLYKFAFVLLIFFPRSASLSLIVFYLPWLLPFHEIDVPPWGMKTYWKQYVAHLCLAPALPHAARSAHT